MAENNSIDAGSLPYGMTKKDLLSLPELKKVRSWFIWAGVVEIGSAAANMIDLGRLMETVGYDNVSTGTALLVGICVMIDLILGISLLATKSATVAYLVGITGIIFAVITVVGGEIPGAGMIAVILALVGAHRINKIWNEYTVLHQGESRYSEQKSYRRRDADFRHIEKEAHDRQENRQHRPEGRLSITRIQKPQGVATFPSRDGNTNPIFFEGIYTFYPTCALGVGFYPETHELGSRPFIIDLTSENAVEPQKEWISFFIRQIDSHITADGRYRLPITVPIYGNGQNPEIPEK